VDVCLPQCTGTHLHKCSKLAKIVQ
jgi:hypothetical protein